MTMLMAGGGVKRGAIVGATDEIGAKAVEAAERSCRDPVAKQRITRSVHTLHYGFGHPCQRDPFRGGFRRPGCR